MYPESGNYNQPPGSVDSDIDAPEAWDIYTGSSEVIIAVVDSGVDYIHRDLQANMWVNSDEIAGNGVDDDGNGYIDDLYGYDFCTYAQERDFDPMDDFGHGTHCSGTIAAQGDNGLDITGVCWNAKIMALKFLGSDGYGDITDAVSAFYYAVDNGADIVSNSWGGGGYLQAAQDAIDYAHSQGVIMVASAGNDNTNSPQYPASYEHMISVAATDSDDQKASFSNYGNWVDIAAPGVDVLSLRADGTSMGTIHDDHTTIASGTSMACPHVAGACAMLFSINPNISVDEARTILEDTSDAISAGICQSGRLNLQMAMAQAISPKGYVYLEDEFYSCSDVVSIRLVDANLQGNGTQDVNVEAGGDLEIVTLNESPGAFGIFTGTIETVTGDPNSTNGSLEVMHGYSITATYFDVNDGNGNSLTVDDTSIVDCEDPIISNVQIQALGRSPTITIETNEATTARLDCGVVCGGPYPIERSDLTLSVMHNVKLTGLSPETDYFFLIEVADAAGNTIVDNNVGQCYSFSTNGPSEINVPGQYSTIQEAIDNSWDGGSVVVADGVYTGAVNRNINFRGRPITVRSEKGPVNCIIDCEDLGRGFYFRSNEVPNSILDGFTITRGYDTTNGGGIKCSGSSPTIINCVLSENSAEDLGGGIYNYQSSPVFIDCMFLKNKAGRWHEDWTGGGGMANRYSNPTLTNCSFVENSGLNAGGIKNENSDTVLTNCLFIGNEDGGSGSGGIQDIFSSSVLTNCTFSGNYGALAGAILCSDDSNSIVTNCIMWGDAAGYGDEIALMAGWAEPSTMTIIHSNIKGGSEGIFLYGGSSFSWGDGNIDEDPNFSKAEPRESLSPWVNVDWDYHLLAGSACIDAGTNEPTGGLPATDMDGYTRLIDGDDDGNSVVDIGAYESQDAPVFIVRPMEYFFTEKTTGPDPNELTMKIYNIGSDPLIWEISEDCNWIHVSPESGETGTEADEVTLQLDAAGLCMWQEQFMCHKITTLFSRQ
jgi:subtilisin family serine protease